MQEEKSRGDKRREGRREVYKRKKIQKTKKKKRKCIKP